MKFRYRYYGQSQIQDTAHSTSMQFAPDTLRARFTSTAFCNPPLHCIFAKRSAACTMWWFLI
jgi:hypothetical protein